MRDVAVFRSTELEVWEQIEGMEKWAKHSAEINGQQLYARCPPGIDIESVWKEISLNRVLTRAPDNARIPVKRTCEPCSLLIPGRTRTWQNMWAAMYVPPIDEVERHCCNLKNLPGFSSPVIHWPTLAYITVKTFDRAPGFLKFDAATSLQNFYVYFTETSLRNWCSSKKRQFPEMHMPNLEQVLSACFIKHSEVAEFVNTNQSKDLITTETIVPCDSKFIGYYLPKRAYLTDISSLAKQENVPIVYHKYDVPDVHVQALLAKLSY
jgi:hypothetical protein